MSKYEDTFQWFQFPGASEFSGGVVFAKGQFELVLASRYMTEPFAKQTAAVLATVGSECPATPLTMHLLT